ncbi:hypothetical protein F5Y15DRAFT_117573 [Xylariaceae sp. FL0016]|nr:hypothetical protein F5Y15DRAFT_117573 [Xylariaceae sp. FL0016]
MTRRPTKTDFLYFWHSDEFDFQPTFFRFRAHPFNSLAVFHIALITITWHDPVSIHTMTRNRGEGKLPRVPSPPPADEARTRPTGDYGRGVAGNTRTSNRGRYAQRFVFKRTPNVHSASQPTEDDRIVFGKFLRSLETPEGKAYFLEKLTESHNFWKDLVMNKYEYANVSVEETLNERFPSRDSSPIHISALFVLYPTKRTPELNFRKPVIEHGSLAFDLAYPHIAPFLEILLPDSVYPKYDTKEQVAARFLHERINIEHKLIQKFGDLLRKPYSPLHWGYRFGIIDGKEDQNVFLKPACYCPLSIQDKDMGWTACKMIDPEFPSASMVVSPKDWEAREKHRTRNKTNAGPSEAPEATAENAEGQKNDDQSRPSPTPASPNPSSAEDSTTSIKKARKDLEEKYDKLEKRIDEEMKWIGWPPPQPWTVKCSLKPEDDSATKLWAEVEIKIEDWGESEQHYGGDELLRNLAEKVDKDYLCEWYGATRRYIYVEQEQEMHRKEQGTGDQFWCWNERHERFWPFSSQSEGTLNQSRDNSTA